MRAIFVEDFVFKSNFKQKQFSRKPESVYIFALNVVCKRDIRFVEFVIYLLSRIARGVASVQDAAYPSYRRPSNPESALIPARTKLPLLSSSFIEKVSCLSAASSVPCNFDIRHLKLRFCWTDRGGITSQSGGYPAMYLANTNITCVDTKLILQHSSFLLYKSYPVGLLYYLLY